MAEANLTYTLAVDDTSPTLAYTPFADNFSPPSYDTGWNPAYTDGASYSVFPDPVTAQGSGASIHVTSANNASVTLRWNGESSRRSRAMKLQFHPRASGPGLSPTCTVCPPAFVPRNEGLLLYYSRHGRGALLY